MLTGKRVLLIVSGGIAAFKSLELIRLIRESGGVVRCVLTSGGAQFVTPLSLSSLSEDKVYQDLFSLTDENEMGHIRLSRDSDLIAVVPASADLLADDLASTLLLATDKPVLVAPAMNKMMWQHLATRRNVQQLIDDGIHFVGPVAGDLACGEIGEGRLSEPQAIMEKIISLINVSNLEKNNGLCGRRALVTSGPTFEAIDPIRYIGNRSSGKQGHAIAAALASKGAETVLVSGPTTLSDPKDVVVVRVETAREMMKACWDALPADIAICAAAVSDWRVAEHSSQKIKKEESLNAPTFQLTENPDILATLGAAGKERPTLLIGFAAETENLINNATAKKKRKGCDWLIANDVSAASGVMGADDNTVHLITDAGIESWLRMSKQKIALVLSDMISEHFTALSERG